MDISLNLKSFSTQNHDENWLGTWIASAQPPYSSGISKNGCHNQTLRLIVHPHMSGSALRLRFSNVFGSNALTFGKVHVAHSAGASSIIPETDHQVTFHGKPSVTIPVGKRMVSDPVPLGVKSGQDLAVSVYIPERSGPTTWHAWARQTSYIASANQTSEPFGQLFDKKENAWFWLEAIDVRANSSVKGAVVTFGDSITDAGHSTSNANRRWPDFLAERFNHLPQDQQYSVLNAGISGNEILQQSTSGGISALDRIEQDVFSQNRVTDVIFLEGINDIIHPPSASADEIIQGIKQIITQTHERNINIYGGTLTPFKDHVAYSSAAEAIREKVNHWIRKSNAFDGVIDFDKALRDPQHPLYMRSSYHSGDYLHPGDTGLKAMAHCIDLAQFGGPV